MRIVGTAGHVDHGKSSLVIALTGQNPDRWVEERERGMTLDLGFARLAFPDGIEAGIIDVPGHERFLHNMLAGAAGMDLLLLVVDAGEGPREQTREHLQILSFLNVRDAIVVLTKADTVDAARLEQARSAVRSTVAGTVAEGAPIVAVSNVTGSGIDALKSEMHRALAALPERPAGAPAYLPVDRVFTLPGHGTIVTGTLMQGTIRVGDTLLLQPSGQEARVRSLQTFGHKLKEATAGSRVAVNMPAIDPGTIARGEVLAAAEFTPAAALRVEFTPLAGALTLLRRRTQVRAHIGAAEILGRLTLDDGPPARPVAQRALLSLESPTIVYPGSRIVLRRLSPKQLLGGAVVIGVAGGAIESASVDRGREADAVQDRVRAIVQSAGLSPQGARSVAAASNVVEAVAQQALDALVQCGEAVALAKPLEYISRAAFEQAFAAVSDALRRRHEQMPWRMGCSQAELAAVLGSPEPLAARLLAAWHDDGRLARRHNAWHLPDFTPSLTAQQRAFFDRHAPAGGNSLQPIPFESIVSAASAERILGLREALETLIALGAFVKIGDDLYVRSQFERARNIVSAVIEKQPAGATMAQLRDAMGTSRKYALPLMEYLDSAGFTIRDGDVRRLRTSAGKRKT